MGKKLDYLLGRNFKTSKFKMLVSLAISRIAVLKNQHHVRCTQARSDVIQLLNLGHHERALFRIDHVMKEQNTLDVFAMLENYCELLKERAVLLQNNRECPDELKEAMSSMIFAASRCGEFPEVQQIRKIFTARFGKEFAARAVELRNNCGVNPKMIQKLSTRQASYTSRLDILKQIASENGIILHLEDDVSLITEEKVDVEQNEQQLEPEKAARTRDSEVRIGAQNMADGMIRVEELSASIKSRMKYRDVAAAAQEAFESAAYAAAAARAAVELSRTESRDEDPDDHCGSGNQNRTVVDSDGSPTYRFQIERYASLEDFEHLEKELASNKMHPAESFSLESEGEEMAENSTGGRLKELEWSKIEPGLERTVSASSSDSDGNNSSNRKITANLNDENEQLGREIISHQSENEIEKPDDEIQQSKQELNSDGKSHFPVIEFKETAEDNEVGEDNLSNTTEISFEADLQNGAIQISN